MNVDLTKYAVSYSSLIFYVSFMILDKTLKLNFFLFLHQFLMSLMFLNERNDYFC